MQARAELLEPFSYDRAVREASRRIRSGAFLCGPLSSVEFMLRLLNPPSNDSFELNLLFFCFAPKLDLKLIERKFMTYGEVLPIWWSMFWRGVLGGVAAGLIAGGAAGFVAALLGHVDAAATWGEIAGAIVAIPVSLWAMRAAINRHYLRPANT